MAVIASWGNVSYFKGLRAANREYLVGHKACIWKFTNMNIPMDRMYVSTNMNLQRKDGCLTQAKNKRLRKCLKAIPEFGLHLSRAVE